MSHFTCLNVIVFFAILLSLLVNLLTAISVVTDRQAVASIPGRCGVAATMARLPPLLRPVLCW